MATLDPGSSAGDDRVGASWDVDEHILEWTLTASRALLGVIARTVAPALEKVTLPQFRVLVILSGNGPLRMGDLAERMGVHPSTFSRTVERMVSKGWLTRAVNGGSRREILVHATPEAHRLVDAVTQQRRDELRHILGGLEPAKQQAIGRALRLLADAAGEPAPKSLLTLGIWTQR